MGATLLLAILLLLTISHSFRSVHLFQTRELFIYSGCPTNLNVGIPHRLTHKSTALFNYWNIAKSAILITAPTKYHSSLPSHFTFSNPARLEPLNIHKTVKYTHHSVHVPVVVRDDGLPVALLARRVPQLHLTYNRDDLWSLGKPLAPRSFPQLHLTMSSFSLDHFIALHCLVEFLPLQSCPRHIRVSLIIGNHRSAAVVVLRGSQFTARWPTASCYGLSFLTL